MEQKLYFEKKLLMHEEKIMIILQKLEKTEN